VLLPGRKTGLTAIMQRDSWRNILTYPGTIFDLRKENLDLEYLASAQHFHLSSFYLQRGLQDDVPELLKELKEAGLTISLDCNDDPEDRWEDGIRECYVTSMSSFPTRGRHCGSLKRATRSLPLESSPKLFPWWL
jgi:sugar/nucleoside kinase (ribokinase family)